MLKTTPRPKITQYLLAFLLFSLCAFCIYTIAHYRMITVTIPQPIHKQGQHYFFSLPKLPLGLNLLYTYTTSNSKGRIYLYENGKPLPFPKASLEDIKTLGGGRYRLDETTVHFSPIDTNDTSPLNNTYSVSIHIKAHWYIYITAVLSGLLASALLIPSLLQLIFLRRDNSDNKKIIILCLIGAMAISAAVGGGNYFKPATIYPDTAGYFWYDYKDPWSTMRSPGYPLFLALTGKVAAVVEDNDYLTSAAQTHAKPANPKTWQALATISGIQFIVFAIALFTFLFALSRFLPFFWMGAACTTAMASASLPALNNALTESIAISCILFFCTCALNYFHNSSMRSLVGVCLWAIYGFLIKPALLFLSALGGLLLLHKIYTLRHTPKALFKPLAVSAMLLIGILAFPLQLYITGDKVITLGQLSATTKGMFAFCLAQPEDSQLFKNPQERDMVEYFFELKKEKDKKLDAMYFTLGRENYSRVYRYLFTVNGYGWELMYKAHWAKIRKEQWVPQYVTYREIMNVALPILDKHRTEYYSLMLANFLTTFVPTDYIASPVLTYFQHSQDIKNIFFPTLFFLIALALCFDRSGMRSSIAFLSSLHILNIAVCSIGHAVIPRYASLTEWSFLLAALLACYSMIDRLYAKAKRHV